MPARYALALFVGLIFRTSGSAVEMVPLEAGCDQTLELTGDSSLEFELAPGIDWLQVEQLGIDVEVGQEGGKSDTPSGAWGFETMVPGDSGRMRIVPHDPRASPGHIRLRCFRWADFPADRQAIELLAEAGRLPTDRPTEADAALDRYRRLADSAPATSAAAVWRLQGALGAASLAQDRGEWAEASVLLEQGLAENLDTRPWLRAALLTQQGRVEPNLGRVDRAEVALRQALELWPVERTPERASIFHNLGLIVLRRGQAESALELFRQGFETLGGLEERKVRSELHNASGGALDRLGRLRPALEQYRQALELAKALGDVPAQGSLLSNLAISHSGLGEWQAAIAALEEADRMLRPLDQAQLLGSVNNNIGFVYLGVGDARAAARALEAALVFRRRAGDRRGELISLNNLGRARRQLGQLAAAREAHLQALALADQLADPRQRGICRLRLAETALAEGAPAPALDELARALAGDGLDPRLRAEMLRVRTRALLAADRLDEAAAAGAAARAAAADSEDRLARIEGAVLEAEIARRQGRHHQALAAARGAALDIEAQRESLISTEIRARFLAAHREAFSLWLEAALALGDRAAALEVVERSRTRTLLDVLAAAEVLPVLSFGQMQALLDGETAVLELVLGPRQSHAFLLTRGGVETATLPGETELDLLVRAAIAEQSVARPGLSDAPSCAKLSRLVLAPFRDRLAGFRRLVVVPDGRFASLAMAALPFPASDPHAALLIDRLELIHIPSLAVLARQRALSAGRRNADGFVAVVADPVFAADDPRLAAPARGPSTQALGLERLTGSRDEATAILDLAGERGGQGFFDFAASKAAFLGGGLDRFRYLHIATHGQVDLELGERSGLLLAAFDPEGLPRDALLGLPDIYRLKLHADLAVLSSCESAVGEEIRGEGLISLSRAFLFAGVPKVAATLWRIPDLAASRLMPAFYRALWQERLSPPAALRKAQLELRAQRRFREPFYWAGFVYFGDWLSETAPETITAEPTDLP